jgi:RNA polymerase sigma factor (TIGR02999 family)
MPQQDITRLLLDLSGGNRGALDVLLPLVYDELRLLARGHLMNERAGHTLDSVALVNEAYVKLSDQHRLTPQNRAHFFATASGAMRRILVDHARTKKAAKRGGGVAALPLDGMTALLSDERAMELVALDEALTGLAAVNAEAAQIVEYIYFGGLTYEEIAGVLDTSVSTVRRRWRAAKAWLAVELQAAG